MKKYIVILLVLLLTGCSKLNLSNNKNEINPNISVEEISNKFEYEDGKCRVGFIPVCYSSLNRNNEIDIVDEDDEFYYFDNNGLILAIDKERVRTELDDPFEEYVGYTVYGAEMYYDMDLENFARDFAKNDNVLVKDEFLGVLLVEYDGEEGYMLPNEVRDSLIPTYRYVAPDPTPTYSGGGGNTSGGGGSSSGGDSGGGSSQQEGEQKPIGTGGMIPTNPTAFICDENGTHYETNNSFNKIKGMVLANNSNTYITEFARNSNVKVLSYDDKNVEVLINGFIGKIERKYIKLAEDNDYTSWDGYAYSGTKVYYDFQLENKMTTLDKNDTVSVVDEIDDVYLVMLEDGTYGYVYFENISDTKIPTYHYVAPDPTPSYSGGGGSSSSGGGNTHQDDTPTSSDYSIPAF